MKNIYFLLLLLPLLATVSCKKLLESEPSDFISPEQYYNNEKELQIALTGVYDILGSSNVYGVNQSFYFTFTTDEATPRFGDDVSYYRYDPSNSRISNFWRDLYIGIERANTLLANINKAEMDDTQRDIIRGEALFLRAYYYFLLTSSYGNVPLKLEPTTSVVNTDIPATSSNLIYERIITDMTEAYDLVQDVAQYDAGGVAADNGLTYAGRVTKSAVGGILARVCLTMAGYPVLDRPKYELALYWARKVRDSGRHSLNPDYADIFKKIASDQYDTRESIWEVEFYGNNTGGFNEGSQAIGNLYGIQCNLEGDNPGFSAAYARVSRKLYDAYTVKNGVLFDLRRERNCPDYTYGTTGIKTTQTNIWLFHAGKFRREDETRTPKDKNFTPQNFPLLRYSDVLLMIAEAENELSVSPPQTAVDLVNEVRRRAFGRALRGEIIAGITVNTQGSGYAAATTTVTISGGGGSGATATATIASGRVTAITITNPGSGYNASVPVTITISSSGSGAGATATAIISDLDTEAMLTAEDIASKEAFLKAIQKERSLELCFEALRKPDLIRWGIFYSTMKQFGEYASTNGGPANSTIAPTNLTPRHLLFPIPSREIVLNKALVQNPGW